MTVTVTTPPATRPAQVSGSPQAFDAAKAEWQTWMQTAVPQLNAQNVENNAQYQGALTSAASAAREAAAAAAAATVSQAGAAFKGAWSGLSGALNVPASVLHNGQLWLLTANLANVATATPGVSASWSPLGQFYAQDVADRSPLVQPTLDLDFAKQKYRVYDSATGGLANVALGSVLAYTGSGRDYTDSLGILRTQASNTPRIEFDAATGAGLGLSVWASRTNLLTYSEQIDNAAWTKTRATITANATAAPDGTTTADKLVEDTTATNSHSVFGSATVASGVVYTASVFLKAAELGFAIVRTEGGAGVHGITVNLATGETAFAVGSAAVRTSVAAANGFWRVSFAFTTAGTDCALAVLTSRDGVYANRSYTGDGVSGLFMWGVQLEAGANASPYTPTTTAAVTAPADSASITGGNFSKWFNPIEGTLVVLFRSSEISNQVGIAALGDPSKAFGAADTMYLQHDAALGRVGLIVFDNAVTQSSMSPANSYSYGALACAAMSYANNSFALVTSGSTASTDASGAVPTVTALSVANLAAAWSGGGNHLNGTVARVLYFPRRLSNEQLQLLSAI